MGYFIWNWGKKAQAVVFSQLMSLKTWSGKFGWDSLPNCTTCFWLSRSRWCSDHGEGYRQRCDLDLRKDQSRLNPLNLEVMDRKSVSGAESEARSDSEQGNVSDTDPEEGGKCATEDSNRTWRVPSLQELEEVLHSAPRSCRHGDEVWPNLYLGDMWVFCAWCKFTCIFELSRLRITSALFCCEAPKKVVWITKLLSFFNRLGGEKITSELNFLGWTYPLMKFRARFMSHDKLGLWQLGVTHVLNAAHGKLCCKGSDDFYGTTVKYYGVPANDLPTFDLSPFFYPAAEFIHQALTSGGTL